MGKCFKIREGDLNLICLKDKDHSGNHMGCEISFSQELQWGRSLSDEFGVNLIHPHGSEMMINNLEYAKSRALNEIKRIEKEMESHRE